MIECLSDDTAKTSPYDYVTAVMYPGCASANATTPCKGVCVGANCFTKTSTDGPCDKPVGIGEPCDCGGQCNSIWRSACSNETCFGVPMYRQFLTAGETATTQGPSIRMAGQDTSQRSTLTVNHGKYFIDTAVDRETQSKWVSPPEGVGLNVFQKNEIYYLFDVFAKPTTRQTYQLYVGTGFTKSSDVWATTASIEKRPIEFDKIDPPAGWVFKYGAADGLPAGVLEVTMDMGFPAFKTAYDASPQAHCKPASFCQWNVPGRPNKCSCSEQLKAADPALYDECLKPYEKGKESEAEHRICSVWAVKDVDCPNGKCYGFGVKLGSGFDYAAGQAVRRIRN